MDFKNLMIQHGEKAALGVAGLVLVGYLIIGFGLGGSDPLQPVYATAEAVRGQLRDNAAPKVEFPPYVAMAKDPWATVAEPKPGRDAIAYYMTEMVMVVQQTGTGTGPVVPLEKIRTHRAPSLAQPTASIGKVSLTWSRAKETTAVIANYAIYRKKDGEKDFTKIHDVSGVAPEDSEGGPLGPDFSFDDAGIEAKTSYSYKVRSIARDKDPKKVDNAETESSVVTVTTVSDIEIVLKGGQESLATIHVRKYMNGKWESQAFYVKPEGMIGEPIKKYVGKDQVTIDFSTKYKLLEIKKAKKEFKRMEQQRVKDEQGNVVTKEVERIDMRDALKIIYLDDEGKQQEQWQAE